MEAEFELFSQKDKVSDSRLSLRRYIRRMSYVNTNTAKKMLDWNKEDYVDLNENKKENYDYGNSKNAVLMVDGKISQKIYGYLSEKEYRNVQKVMKYA